MKLDPGLTKLSHQTIPIFAQCVVQSYLKWLEDSNYDPICVLCSKSIQEGEVVRLACYGEFDTMNTTFIIIHYHFFITFLQVMKKPW